MSSYENQDELYSRPVRAGKRTYFFDVKATRGKDLYMTITESKPRFDDHGNVSYSKHKIFLYREDFEKFEEGFLDAVDKSKNSWPRESTGTPSRSAQRKKARPHLKPILPAKTPPTARKTSPSTTSESLIKGGGPVHNSTPLHPISALPSFKPRRVRVPWEKSLL